MQSLKAYSRGIIQACFRISSLASLCQLLRPLSLIRKVTLGTWKMHMKNNTLVSKNPRLLRKGGGPSKGKVPTGFFLFSLLQEAMSNAIMRREGNSTWGKTIELPSPPKLRGLTLITFRSPALRLQETSCKPMYTIQNCSCLLKERKMPRFPSAEVPKLGHRDNPTGRCRKWASQAVWHCKHSRLKSRDSAHE